MNPPKMVWLDASLVNSVKLLKHQKCSSLQDAQNGVLIFNWGLIVSELWILQNRSNFRNWVHGHSGLNCTEVVHEYRYYSLIHCFSSKFLQVPGNPLFDFPKGYESSGTTLSIMYHQHWIYENYVAQPKFLPGGNFQTFLCDLKKTSK